METCDQILCEHYGRMLGLTDGWKVEGVDLSMQERELKLRWAWEKAGAVCPECGKSLPRHDLSPERKWRHLDAMGFETILTARIPRVNCPEHKVVQMKVPWAEKHSRFTLAFEVFAIRVLQASRSISAARGLLNLGWSSLHEIMERAVQRGVDGRGSEWQAALFGKSPEDIRTELVEKGFRHMMINRRAYGDRGEELKNQLVAAGMREIMQNRDFFVLEIGGQEG